MADEPPKRPTWLTLSVAGAAASIVIYVFLIGSEIGTMRQQTANQEIRIVALETHGSGPVQSNAAKVDAVIARADRILTELLAMQQRFADLQATQQSQGVMLQRLQEDVAKVRTP
jgi:Tfp pilus assembly protein PilN